MRKVTRWALTLAFVFAAPAIAKTGEAPHDAETRAAMREIFEAMRVVVPLSLNDGRFADLAQRETIMRALDRLAAGSALLEEHGREREKGFSYLSHSLAQDARDIRNRFDLGKTDEARFLLHELTQTCVACHSRLPDPPPSSLADGFVSQTVFEELPLDERARLEVATRQFDRANDTYEALLRSADVSPATLERGGFLDDYLELCIRVRNDFAGPARALELFAKRDDLSPRMLAEVTTWIGALRAVPAIDPDAPPLTRAKMLLEKAGDIARFPNDRMVLVHYFAASGLLNRYVAEDLPQRTEVAESYYLLGVIESRVGRSIWISQTESFLEAAIRAAPQGPVAEQAYSLLEEFLIAGYTGSAGTRIPADEMGRLRELRALIDGT